MTTSHSPDDYIPFTEYFTEDLMAATVWQLKSGKALDPSQIAMMFLLRISLQC